MPPIIPFPYEVPNESNENDASNENPSDYMSDSDSQSEDENHDGYEPLSQDPDNVIDNQNDLEEDCNFLSEGGDLIESEANFVNQYSLLLPPPPAEAVAADQEMESSKDLTMDADRIETIKSVMKSIILPQSNLPHWASLIPEEEWKAALLSRMLSGTKSNEASAQISCFAEPSTRNDFDSQSDVPR